MLWDGLTIWPSGQHLWPNGPAAWAAGWQDGLHSSHCDYEFYTHTPQAVSGAACPNRRRLAIGERTGWSLRPDLADAFIPRFAPSPHPVELNPRLVSKPIPQGPGTKELIADRHHPRDCPGSFHGGLRS